MNHNAYEFDEIANGPFFPIYPVIAQQIKERTGKTAGTCLDIGCGGGHLGLYLAQTTQLDMILLDKEKEALVIAGRRAADWGINHRVSTLLGDVQQLPLLDKSIDLCISRGSVWFWEDQKKAFAEIDRVLRNGGMAYIGGGFGNAELQAQVDKKMKERDSDWPQSRQKFVAGNTVEKFTGILQEAGIKNFEITDDEKGIWIVFKSMKSTM